LDDKAGSLLQNAVVDLGGMELSDFGLTEAKAK
jgi:hypothetical protein